ncbi:LytTR family transcriptional regulator [Lacihabitans sp. LS3-19]|uniref:LytTR family DNA-binding domain-containing protein n=1 Tax=Lacihabitans sp. LS3-19 TaxID=2487335 RepID=UPI0020CB726E|nr:LytTR family DNA-binding domain-containing protein [Lacihabitans sp. LS3-19]MCP9767173.1 LytTR family transcriptional regulator [Lacihabitans sp. LS3-19]
MITPKIINQISAQSSILFVEADQNYSIFHLKNGRKEVSSYTLKFHQNHLDLDQFVRPNRSLLIHKSFIKNIKESPKACFIQLLNGKDVLVSRRRLKVIQEQYSEAC